MPTRHLYTTQEGIVIVLEHISTIHPTSEYDGSFRVYDLTGKFLTVPDVEFEVTKTIPKYNRGTEETTTYKTTERAELIRKLVAI